MAALHKAIPRRADLARAEIHHQGELVRTASAAVGVQARVHSQPGVVGGCDRAGVSSRTGHARLRRDLSGSFYAKVRAERGRGDVTGVIELPQADEHRFPGHNSRQRKFARLWLSGRDRQGGGECSG